MGLNKKMMKKYPFLFIVVLMFSCNLDVPECNDTLVKKKVLGMVNNELKEDLIKEYIIEKIGADNLRAYARDNRINVEKVIESERNNLSESENESINEILSYNRLIGVRTQKIENNIKKCSCSGEIVNDKNLIEKTKIGYTVHAIEDNVGSAYYEVWIE